MTVTILTVPEINGGVYAGLTCAMDELGNDTILYPLTECCGASGTGSDTPTGVACRECYATVPALYGGCVKLSESAADWLVRSAAMTNNGGGIPDEGHLFGETDCPSPSCEAPSDGACPHGYIGAYETAYVLGWLEGDDLITDKWQP